MIQLLYLVHGMGCGARTDGTTWYAEVKTSLDGLLKQFPSGGATLDAQLTWTEPSAGADAIWVVPITYHNIFDDWRTQAAASTLPVADVMKKAGFGVNLSAGATSALQSAGDFFWTHILDVVLYRYQPVAATKPIRTSVGSSILSTWQRADVLNGNVDTPVHFLAHSLGTVVLHDALSGLVSYGFGPGSKRIDTMLMLANVSNLLQTDFDAYGSVDRPVGAPAATGIDGPGMTTQYVDIRHEIDPIPMVDAFNPTPWGAKRYYENVLVDVKDWDVHAFCHYLENPDAHFPLFEDIWPGVAWPDLYAAAVARFKGIPPANCAAALAQLRIDLKGILTSVPSSTDTIDQFLETAGNALAAIAKAEAACKQTTAPAGPAAPAAAVAAK